jgi:hypothetical protein
MAIGIDATRIGCRSGVGDLDLIAGHDDANRPVQIGAMDVQARHGGQMGERLSMGMPVPVADSTRYDGDARADGVQEVDA